MATTKDLVQLLFEEKPRYENAPSGAPYRLSTIARYFPLQSCGFQPNPQFIDRGDEIRGTEGAPSMLIDGYEPAASMQTRAYVDDLVFLLHLAGFTGVYTAGAGGGTDEVQTITITGTPTGGTYTLTFDAEATATLPYNAIASDVQVALEALTNIGTGNIVCAGGPHPGTAITATFSNDMGKKNVSQMTANSAGLTGGTTPTVTPTTTTPGVAGSVTDPDGGTLPTGAHKWVFDKRTGIQPQTAQIRACYADELVFLRGQGFGISQLSMNAGGDLSCDLVGLVLGNLATDPNLTPALASDEIPFLRRGDCKLTWLTGSGSTDDFSFQITNGLNRVREFGRASYYPNVLEHADERVRISGSIPKRGLVDVDIDALLAGTTFAAAARWKSPKVIGATAYKHSMWLNMPKAQIVGGGPDPLTNARRFGGSYDWFASNDEAAGYDARITLVGSVTAVSAY